jgi:amino acid adenylation domain-containing protein
MNHRMADQDAIHQRCFHPTGAFVEFGREEIEQSIAARFEKIARLYPDRTAVKMGQQRLTYDELNRAANRLARAILALRGEGNEPVVLLFEPGIRPIVAILGLLKAGKIYVPLDPSFPRDRIRTILEDCDSKLFVTDRRGSTFLNQRGESGVEALDIEAIDSAIPDGDLRLPLPPDLRASIMYTSGSTGRPKGVVQNHLGILHRAMVYTNMLHVCASDRLTLLHSCSFGSSIHHLFSSLLNGAALFPFEARVDGGISLARWLKQEEMTIYHSVPSLFRQCMEAVTGHETFSALRAISLTGASISAQDVALYKKHFPESCVLVHLMGATEAGWIRRYFIDHAGSVEHGTVPVGFPIEDKAVLLLNDEGVETEQGEAGEIAIRSRYLAVGYWNRPDLTREKFVAPPDAADEQIYLTGDMGRLSVDGCLSHLGRKDFLVKVRGFRVEMGEIESAISALAQVKEAVVVAADDGNEEKRLLAYVVPERDAQVSSTSLRRLLKDELPDYMIPQTFVTLAALPLTANGKIDRRSLPDPGTLRPQLDTPYEAPKTAVEESLARIWGDVLDLCAVGIRDNFFELGGSSLSAARIVAKVNETFGIELSLRNFMDVPHIAGMAGIVILLRGSKDSAGIEFPDRAVDEEIGEL